MLVLGCAACASTREGDEPPRKGEVLHPIAQIVEARAQPEPIGELLVQLDQRIQAWNNLFLSADTQDEKRRARLLEDDLMRLAHKRRADLIEQVRSGPTANRVVAAAALGFTRDAEAQSPLLAALEDREDSVVASALLGLWLLGRSDTPLEPISRAMTDGATEGVRANAALCLASLVKEGAQNEHAATAARMGLLDRSPAVRSSAALILGNLRDGASVQALSDRLYDEVVLVAAAAAKALAFVGAEVTEQRGPAARALVTAWIKLPEPAKGQMFRAMVTLSGQHFGSDEEEWGKWATRLP